MISMSSCVRGKIPVHLLEGWWFRCIHVWGVGFRCIYLRSDDFGAFKCEGYSGAFTWGMMISVFSCVKGRISVLSPEDRRFRCIHVWGVGFRCTYLRDYDFGAFMFERYEFVVFIGGLMISVHACVMGKIPVHYVWGVGFWCIYIRDGYVHGYGYPVSLRADM